MSSTLAEYVIKMGAFRGWHLHHHHLRLRECPSQAFETTFSFGDCASARGPRLKELRFKSSQPISFPPKPLMTGACII